VDEHAVIVLQAGEQLDLGGHVESSLDFPERNITKPPS
jgi:hypothetical protein